MSSTETIRVHVELVANHEPNKFLRNHNGATVTRGFREKVLPLAEATRKGSLVVAVALPFQLQEWMTDRQVEDLLVRDHLFSETQASVLASSLVTCRREALAPAGGSTILFTQRWVVRIYSSLVRGYVVDTHHRGTWEWRGVLHLFSPPGGRK